VAALVLSLSVLLEQRICIPAPQKVLLGVIAPVDDDARVRDRLYLCAQQQLRVGSSSPLRDVVHMALHTHRLERTRLQSTRHAPRSLSLHGRTVIAAEF
jgi:hypothetical protein